MKKHRKKIKHVNLSKKYTLKRRQEFLDTEYINGVYDHKGNQVIRPLNDEEKDWLDQYYKETLNASFNQKDSFWSISPLDELPRKERRKLTKKILKYFLGNTPTPKRVDQDLVTDKNLKKVAKKFKVTPTLIYNLIKRKEIYDANNMLNNDIIKVGLRTNCEAEQDEDVETDIFYPTDNHKFGQNVADNFEDSMNEYLDFKLKKEMGWRDE